MTPEAEKESRAPKDSVAGCRRWLIVGASGAGKSRLAREMGELLALPVIHLDRHFWSSGWVEPDRQQWARQVEELSSGDAWIMDGNYGGSIALRLPRAEVAVMLDPPVWQCLWGILRRSTIYRGESRPDMAEGCEERLPYWAFIRYVLTYKWRSRPRVLERVAAESHVRFYHLKSRRAARRFMSDLRDAVQVAAAGESG